MFRFLVRSFSLRRQILSPRSFSTTGALNTDPACKFEAPLIDNDIVLATPQKRTDREILQLQIQVPMQYNIVPISGVPEDHITSRRVRIYQPTKNAMQSGTHNIHHWEIEFENRERWENPLMGWCSTGDPLSVHRVKFSSRRKAIDLCEKNGWTWFLDAPRKDKPAKPKSYGTNFSYNHRTRISTK